MRVSRRDLTYDATFEILRVLKDFNERFLRCERFQGVRDFKGERDLNV